METKNSARNQRNADSKTPMAGMGDSKRKSKTLGSEKKIAEDEFMAAAIGDVEWLKQSLRGNKGSINFDKNGLAPIHLTAIHGRLDCLKYLIEKRKVDMNLASSTGWRPVHLCISNQTGKRAFQCLLYLLEKNADPSACNDDQITPVHQAASEGHVQCLKALVEVGAKIDMRDSRGHLPIDLAKLWGHRKCARILAAECWHQSKEFLAKEMKHMQKLQVQQVLADIVADEADEADQQFYGDLAFNSWLETKGMNKTPPAKADQSKKKGKSEKAKLRPIPASNTPHRANSYQPPSPIQEESPLQHAAHQRKVQVVSRKSIADSLTDSEGLYEKPAKSPEEEDEPAVDETMNSFSLYGPRWNKSTKIVGKEYVPNLGDHYPHDEYSMQPKHTPKRFSRSPTFLLLSEGENPDGTPIRMPQLPADVINKKLQPLKYERPVVYKCKHIADVHKRFHPEFESLPRHEAGIHLSNDVSSHIFQNGLLFGQTPATPSTALSDFSRWSDDDKPLAQQFDLPAMTHLFRRLGKKECYPGLKGDQYDLNFGQVAAI